MSDDVQVNNSGDDLGVDDSDKQHKHVQDITSTSVPFALELSTGLWTATADFSYVVTAKTGWH